MGWIVMSLRGEFRYSGDKTFCWTYKDGHAVRTEIRTGVSDGEWIEVTNLQRPTASNVDHLWTPINGSEQVILGDLSILADGTPVEVAPATKETKVVRATPPPPVAVR
jgi:HlyD family secretion protein